MSIKCLLCGEEFGAITNTHLKYVHDVTLDDYRRMFPGVELASKELRYRLSDAVSEALTEDVRKQMSESHIGHEVSEETRKQIAASLDGRERSEETKRKLSVSLTDFWCSEEGEEVRQKLSVWRAGYKSSEVTKQKIKASMKANWRDPDFARRMVESWNRKPNETELQLQSVLDAYFPDEWDYVGDGQVVLGGRIPDFINIDGKKQIIEVFGVYWHDPDLFPNRPSEVELIVHYKLFGFDCLVLWEYDVWDGVEVSKRIWEYFSVRR